MTHPEGEPVEVRIATADGIDITEVVRQTYDMATSSMNYGSGFLSTEEMQSLLDLARILRADDVLDVQAKLARMKFPDGRFGSEHTFQPDREESIDGEKARCLVCGQQARGWPYRHGLDIYPPEGREKIAEQIATEMEFQVYTSAAIKIAAPAPAVEAQWERETGPEGIVIIRVTAAGVLPDTVLPHGKSKAVEAGDVFQFREQDPISHDQPGGH